LKRIAGNYLLVEASEEEDRLQNTDLIVLRMEAVRVACRVRQYRYLAKYGDEFTIRVSRPSGVPTELDKILDGWGDYLLYAFADESERILAAWHWVDLAEFRTWCLESRPIPGIVKGNFDGSSLFRAFPVQGMPPGIVKHSVNCGK